MQVKGYSHKEHNPEAYDHAFRISEFDCAFDDHTFAPPELVILCKLEYFREGGSTKHLTDIRAMLDVSGDAIDRVTLDSWILRLGLQVEWARVSSSSSD